MDPYELREMIQRIRKSTDSNLIQVLEAIVHELDDRTKKRRALTQIKREKG